MTTITKEMVQEVYELLQNPKNHTTDLYARDAHGKQVDLRAPEAQQWCLLGAFVKVFWKSSDQDAPLDDISLSLGFLVRQYAPSYGSTIGLNDRGGYTEVMEFLSWLLDRYSSQK